MKRTLIIAGIIALLLPSAAFAQVTASGTLTVQATVTGSINLVFNTDTGNSGVVLGGAGTNAATLTFGSVSAYGALPAGVTRPSVTATDFTVQTPILIAVTKANSSSTDCALTARLGSADAVNTWTVGGTTVTSAAAASINPNFAYNATGNSLAVALRIPFTSTANVSNTINFTATAN